MSKGLFLRDIEVDGMLHRLGDKIGLVACCLLLSYFLFGLILVLGLFLRVLILFYFLFRFLVVFLTLSFIYFGFYYCPFLSLLLVSRFPFPITFLVIFFLSHVCLTVVLSLCITVIFTFVSRNFTSLIIIQIGGRGREGRGMGGDRRGREKEEWNMGGIGAGGG